MINEHQKKYPTTVGTYMKRKKQSFGRKKKKTINGLSDKILAILRKDHSKPYNYKQLAAKLGVDDANSRNQIIKVLKELQGSKEIQEIDRGKYILTPNQNYYTGRVDIAGRGQGYIIVDELEDDILVKNKNLNKALNGDTVEVYVYKRKRGGKSEGEITKIIERKKTEFVGTINIQDRFAISEACILVSILFAYSSTSAGNSYGKPYCASILCISVLCSPGIPKLLITLPLGESAFSGQSIISTRTLSPCFAPLILLLCTNISVYIL